MHLTQIEMLANYQKNITFVKKYNKQGSVLARKSMSNEIIVTEIDGAIETRNTAKEGDVLVQGLKGERYLIGADKFKSRYQGKSELSDVFQEYDATGVCFAYEYKDEPVEFIAPWNELMIVNTGDYLAAPDESYNEVYRIEKDAFAKTYKLA